MSVEAAALRRFLQAQRDSVVAVLDGLDDERAAVVVVPSGWNPLDLVDHLRAAERHWFEVVVSGTPGRPGGDPFHGGVLGQPGRTVRDVVAAYRDQWVASDRVVTAHDLDSPVVAAVPDTLVEDVRDLRGVLLHLVEETARHAGHLDVVRELIDGRVGLGPR